MRFLTPPSSATIAMDSRCAFSKMRGAAPMTVGCDAARLSTILSTLPSMAVGKPISSGSASMTLPKACASGSHRKFRSSGPSMSNASIAAAV